MMTRTIRNRRRFGSALAVAMITTAGLAACGSGGETAPQATSTQAAAAATSTTAAPEEVDVEVVAVADHCGQPAIGEPITGSRDDVRKIQIDEPGGYTATWRADGGGHFSIIIRDDTGELGGITGRELLANDSGADPYEGTKAFDVETPGDFRLEINASDDYEIVFARF